MVSFTKVDPSEIPRTRGGRRGRVAYPIIKGFMESNHLCVKLDTTGMPQKQMSLRAGLTSFIQNHDLPIRVFSADGELYLMRIDMDENGNIDPNWRDTDDNRLKKSRTHSRPEPITPDEVERRFADEGKDTTK